MGNDESNKLVIGPIHLGLAAGGTLRALVTGAALALAEYDTDTLEKVRLEDLRDNVGSVHQRWAALHYAAIANDPLWRQTFAALSVGPIEFARFEMERIRYALLWPRLFKELVDDLKQKHGYESAVIRIVVGDAGLTEAQINTLDADCGASVLILDDDDYDDFGPTDEWS